MCSCNNTGRLHELIGGVTIYAPCPYCPPEIRDARTKIAKDRLAKRLRDARAKMRREQHVTRSLSQTAENYRGA